MTDANLILPSRVEKAATKTLGTGVYSPATNIYNFSKKSNENQGIATKRGRWRDYYDMYRTHSIVRAAVDKIAKVATNVGMDYVPRDQRSEVNDAEVAVLRDFFRGQPDFLAELRRIYKDLLIYGDAYMYVVPNKRREPYRLKRLAPNTIFIETDLSGEPTAYYQTLDPMLASNTDNVRTFQTHEILHFRIDDPDNDVYGLSPLESLKYAVATDIHAVRYNAAFFENAGVTGTIIGIKNANPEEVERNRKWLQENYTGVNGAHKLIVVEGENVTISKSVATHSEMGFLEGRRFIIMEILAVLDVPPAKVGMMETANRSNSKEQDKTFRTESVSPLQVVVQNVINDQFVKPILGVNDTIIVHAEGDTRDIIEQMDFYTKGIAWAVYNVNEVRDKFGMPHVEGGDTNGIMTPTGFVPLDRMDLYFQIPRTNTADIPAADIIDDPVEGEPMPKNPDKVRTALPQATKKAATYGLQDAVITLLNPNTSDIELKKAYADLADADLSDDSMISLAREYVKKALTTDDDLLKEGYRLKAQSAVQQIVQVVRERMIEDEATD